MIGFLQSREPLRRVFDGQEKLLIWDESRWHLDDLDAYNLYHKTIIKVAHKNV